MAAKRKPGSRKSAISRDVKHQPWHPTAEHVDIYRRWCAGESQTEIARRIGCPQPQISRICKATEAWLVARTMDDIRGLKLRQTTRLEKYIEELEAAWERSKQNAETRTIEEIAIEAGDENLPAKKTKVQTTGQCGQVAYLDAAMSAMDRIRKIWGADAPIQVQHHGEIRVAGMSREDAAEAYYRQKLEEVARAREQQMQPHPN